MSLSDNEVIAMLISRVETQLAEWPWPSSILPFPVGVSQKEQPTQQGRPEEDQTIFIEKLFDKIHGSADVEYTPHVEPLKCNEIETSVYLTTYQFSAACTQHPNNISRPTASDLADIIRMILQRRTTIRAFAAQGLSVLRVTDVRNSYFTNEQDRQEAMPSFDLVVSYTRTTPPAVIDQLHRVEPIIHQV